MTNLKLVFLCFIAFSAVSAEFLFEKNIAADDKFMCLHKKLYRREKPAAKSNPARILSMMRNLQALYPPGLTSEYQADYNGMISYLTEAGRFSFIISGRTGSAYATALYQNGFIDFFKSDEFKTLVSEAVGYTYDNFKLNNLLANNPVSSTLFVSKVAANTKLRVDQMMTEYLKQYNIDQAQKDGISYNKLVYVMLNVLSIFKEDAKTARTAYEDYYSLNKDQVVNTDAINSAAIVRWIESIKTRYAQLRATPTPDTEKLIEPFEDSGDVPVEQPSGDYLETVDLPTTPTPPEINEEQPKTPVIPKVNEDLLIPDMLIEIQRTYNVYRMLLAYNQLTTSLKDDINSCNLNMQPALQRCEAAYGKNNCEAVSATMVNQKCPTGYLRQGCCKCVIECDSTEFYTENRAFCTLKSELHSVPTITAASSATGSNTVNSAIGIAIGSCKQGFALNKFVCYKTCPLNTRQIAGTCLKHKPIVLGSPFMWTAGDE